MKIGAVGLSPGNGHPFSFSAIINGFDAAKFASSGWPVIEAYLARQDPGDFGFPGARVTHAWTQDRAVTASLCQACDIQVACETYDELVANVDTVIIARDDWACHGELALPALAAGRTVFVDKPLTLSLDELTAFEPYLRSGKLMSTSGLRYARELDDLRAAPEQLGDVRLIEAVVLNQLETYGIHLIDAIHGLGFGPPMRATRIDVPHPAYALELATGIPVTLHCLGDVGRTFRLSVFGTAGHQSFDLHDNFSAFRRTLGAFMRMCEDGVAPIPPGDLCATMRLVHRMIELAPGESANAS